MGFSGIRAAARAAAVIGYHKVFLLLFLTVPFDRVAFTFFEKRKSKTNKYIKRLVRKLLESKPLRNLGKGSSAQHVFCME